MLQYFEGRAVGASSCMSPKDWKYIPDCMSRASVWECRVRAKNCWGSLNALVTLHLTLNCLNGYICCTCMYMYICDIYVYFIYIYIYAFLLTEKKQMMEVKANYVRILRQQGPEATDIVVSPSRKLLSLLQLPRWLQTEPQILCWILLLELHVHSHRLLSYPMPW